MVFLITVAIMAAIGYELYQKGYIGGLGNLTNLFTGNLSASQIAVYASNAGFSGDALVTIVAIALAESGGNPNAYNPETASGAGANQGSYGLWQIFLMDNPQYANENLYDPQTNANAARDIYNNSGFGAWSTYSDGSYLSYVAEAQASVSQ